MNGPISNLPISPNQVVIRTQSLDESRLTHFQKLDHYSTNAFFRFYMSSWIFFKSGIQLLNDKMTFLYDTSLKFKHLVWLSVSSFEDDGLSGLFISASLSTVRNLRLLK